MNSVRTFAALPVSAKSATDIELDECEVLLRHAIEILRDLTLAYQV
jgi:hypothetical protein